MVVIDGTDIIGVGVKNPVNDEWAGNNPAEGPGVAVVDVNDKE